MAIRTAGWSSADTRSRVLLVGAAALDTDHALGNGRQADLRIEARGDARFQSQPGQARAGEHDGIHFPRIVPPQPGIDVAAQGFYFQVGAGGQQLRLAPQARGADARAARQVVESGRFGSDERVAGIRPVEHRGDDEAFGKIAGQILHRMHGDVGTGLLERHLQFLDEQSLAADGGEAPILNAVTLGQQGYELNLESRMRLPQQHRDVMGLPESQLTLAGGDAQRRNGRRVHAESGLGGNSADFSR